MMLAIDDEVSCGRLSVSAFRQLVLAEGNGNASPMRWLGERLQHVRTTIQSGQPVKVSMPDSILVIDTLAKFNGWCAKEFPDAFSCFFADSETQ
jgi:hypothetical protein